MLSIFEFLAEHQPWILLDLQYMRLLVIADFIPAGMARLMRHRAYKRVGRRQRQVVFE